MANHNLPQTTSTYVNFVSELDARFDDLAVGLDPAVTTATNVPTNSIRWNSSLKYWEKYNGTTWGALSPSFSININGTVGATTPSTGAFTTLSSSSTTALAAGTTIGGNAAVTVSDTQTLTNKTLTSPVISTITNTGTLTLPTSTDTLVGRATTDTLTNKTLTAPRFADLGFIADSSGNKLLIFDSVASAVNEVTLTNAATTGTPSISATGGDTNISLNLVSKGTGTVRANNVDVVTTTGTQTLTNKTLTSPTISSIVNTGTLTLPTDTDTLVGRATTDTLTNKTLTAPRFADLGFIADSSGNELLEFDSNASAVNYLSVINAATAANPALAARGSDTNISLNLVPKGTGTVQANGVDVVTTTGTQTLTNKTLTTPTLSATASGTTAGRLGYSSGALSYGNGTVQRTVVNTDETQTLTNKTLSTSSVWNGGTIGVTYGGTGTATAPTQGGIIYGASTSAYASTAAGTSNQILQSNGASAPTWVSFDLSIHAPDSSYKKVVRVATTADLGASTFASNVLTGYDDTLSLAVTTTASSTTATTTSTAGIKVGATISGNANIPVGTTVASITNATTFVLSAAATAAGTGVTTTFTQTIAALSIDGVTLSVNDRVLVKDQRTLGGLIATDAAKYNGIYTVTATGSTTVPWTLTRSGDADASGDIDSAVVNVSVGTANAGKTFQTYFSGTSTLNTTTMYWNRVVDANASSLIGTPTSASGINIAIPSSTTMTVAGAVTDFVSNSLGIETLQSTSASTYTRASTLYIAGAPVASTNVTITTPYSLYVAGGNTYLGGTLATAGNLSTAGVLSVTGTATTAGAFNASTTTPTGTTRLNYEGYFYPTFINLAGSGDTTTAATHYFVETGTDGFVRPKTLANVQSEIVTTATVSATTLTAGSASTGALKYNGTTAAAGQFDGGTTTPTGTTRLNYGGAFHPTSLNLAGTAETSTAATHYFVETTTDGFVRPKTLANVKSEIVTTAAVNAAAATTVGTITSGTWSATDIALAAGGTGASLTAVAGGVVYSTASAMGISAAGTSGQAFLSGGTGVPTWGTLGLGAGGTGATTQIAALQNLGAIASQTVAKTAAYTVVVGDRGDVILCSGTFTVTLTAAATLANGFSVGIINTGTGTITIDPNASETIDGLTTKVLTPGQSCIIITDGTSWRTLGLSGGGAVGGGADQIFYENDQTVTTNYTLATGKNAMSAGPITINNGITVTISSGSNWSIV